MSPQRRAASLRAGGLTASAVLVTILVATQWRAPRCPIAELSAQVRPLLPSGTLTACFTAALSHAAGVNS